MGYNTQFIGQFRLSKNLDDVLVDRFNKLQTKRHDLNSYPSRYNQWYIKRQYGNQYLAWNGGEKFRHYFAWLDLVCKQYLEMWGVTLSGYVTYVGEDKSDYGVIECSEKVNLQNGISYTKMLVYKLSDPKWERETIEKAIEIEVGEYNEIRRWIR